MLFLAYSYIYTVPLAFKLTANQRVEFLPMHFQRTLNFLMLHFTGLAAYNGPLAEWKSQESVLGSELSACDSKVSVESPCRVSR